MPVSRLRRGGARARRRECTAAGGRAWSPVEEVQRESRREAGGVTPPAEPACFVPSVPLHSSNDQEDQEAEGDDPGELDRDDDERCSGNGRAGLRRLLPLRRRSWLHLDRRCFLWQRRREAPLSLDSPLLILAYCQRRPQLPLHAALVQEDPSAKGDLRLTHLPFGLKSCSDSCQAQQPRPWRSGRRDGRAGVRRAGGVVTGCGLQASTERGAGRPRELGGRERARQPRRWRADRRGACLSFTDRSAGCFHR